MAEQFRQIDPEWIKCVLCPLAASRGNCPIKEVLFEADPNDNRSLAASLDKYNIGKDEPDQIKLASTGCDLNAKILWLSLLCPQGSGIYSVFRSIGPENKSWQSNIKFLT